MLNFKEENPMHHRQMCVLSSVIIISAMLNKSDISIME